jgi:hypothetical protein
MFMWAIIHLSIGIRQGMLRLKLSKKMQKKGLDLGFVFASNDGSATIGVVVFVAEGLGFVVAL